MQLGNSRSACARSSNIGAVKSVLLRSGSVALWMVVFPLLFTGVMTLYSLVANQCRKSAVTYDCQSGLAGPGHGLGTKASSVCAKPTPRRRSSSSSCGYLRAYGRTRSPGSGATMTALPLSIIQKTFLAAKMRRRTNPATRATKDAKTCQLCPPQQILVLLNLCFECGSLPENTACLLYFVR